MEKAPEGLPYRIEPWRKDLDATAFSSGMEQIDRYIKQQAHRDMSSHVSLVFVLTELDSKIISGFYSLSALGIVFNDLPRNVQSRLPRYPQVGATLLGRLGVDLAYKAKLLKDMQSKYNLPDDLVSSLTERVKIESKSPKD